MMAMPSWRPSRSAVAAAMGASRPCTAEFAASIGADFYAKDAAESARIATAFFG